MKQFNFKKIFAISQFVLILITLIISICALTPHTTINRQVNESYFIEVYRGDVELKFEGSKCDMVDAIQHYIDSVAPASCVSGRILFEKCEEYNIDVRFAMAQAQIESHFGTTGVASKTNSIFNVMAYDGESADTMIRKGRGYTHPDHSIEPYLKLLNESYLVKGKTERDLLDKFVNVSGKRYASNPNYESSMLSIYNRICNETPLTDKYKNYIKYKTILEK